MSSSTTTTNPAPSDKTSTPTGADARYTFDETKLEDLRQNKPWTSNPKYFTGVDVSPSAIMKMMMHCHSGVEKGMKKGGNPIEVMGLLLGRPDPDTPKQLVVTDAFPIPIEGFETRVVADDLDAQNYMISLGESLERTRKEKIMGWYHSHPFDVGTDSHCYLSQTDINTQLLWQRSEDPRGNPFLAIVVDPLRSLAKNVPEIKAFRVYPPEYNSPVTNECPDGNIIAEEQARLEKWGSCWSRYYELKVQYFMSGSARNVMGILTQNFLWMRTLGSTPMLETENRQRYPDRVAAVAEKVKVLDVASSATAVGSGGVVGGAGRAASHHHQARGMGFGGGGGGGAAAGGGAGWQPLSSTPVPSGIAVENGKEDDGGELGKAIQGVVELAEERIHGNVVQLAKKELFS
mmetsp:Transcript_54515/g.81191  ORF Transcript_54515/g.81191 Transcript_54515/m.81191 type:complete len:404 (+) Transcript_54515:124-1335(+)